MGQHRAVEEAPVPCLQPRRAEDSTWTLKPHTRGRRIGFQCPTPLNTVGKHSEQMPEVYLHLRAMALPFWVHFTLFSSIPLEPRGVFIVQHFQGHTWAGSIASPLAAPAPSVPGVWSPRSHKSFREVQGNSLEYFLDVPPLCGCIYLLV